MMALKPKVQKKARKTLDINRGESDELCSDVIEDMIINDANIPLLAAIGLGVPSAPIANNRRTTQLGLDSSSWFPSKRDSTPVEPLYSSWELSNEIASKNQGKLT